MLTIHQEKSKQKKKEMSKWNGFIFYSNYSNLLVPPTEISVLKYSWEPLCPTEQNSLHIHLAIHSLQCICSCFCFVCVFILNKDLVWIKMVKYIQASNVNMLQHHNNHHEITDLMFLINSVFSSFLIFSLIPFLEK